MELDGKEGKIAEAGNKNSKRGLKSGELPDNLKPKFPAKKAPKSDEEQQQQPPVMEKKEGKEGNGEEIVIDGNDKEVEENAHHSLSPAVPLTPVKTEEKLAKMKKSDYVNQKSDGVDAKENKENKENEEPAHHSPSEPTPLKPVKTSENLEKTGEKLKKKGSAENLEDKKNKKPVAESPKVAPADANGEQKSAERVKKGQGAQKASAEQKGFFKNVFKKKFRPSTKTVEATANPTPEQMAKPYVAPEYGFGGTGTGEYISNDFRPILAASQATMKGAERFRIHQNKENRTGPFIANRPFWCDGRTNADKNPPARSRIQMHKRLKKIVEGNKNAILPPLPPRTKFIDARKCSKETIMAVNAQIGKHFEPKQLVANTFYATLYFENEKVKYDKEAASHEEKKLPEKTLKWKTDTTLSLNYPTNVLANLNTYDRKDRPGVHFDDYADEKPGDDKKKKPLIRHFKGVPYKIEPKPKDPKKSASTTSVTSTSKSDSKKI